MRDDFPEPSEPAARELETRERRSTYPSVAALAADLGLSDRSTRSALRRGAIPHIRVGRRFILPRGAIADWLRTASLSVAIQGSPAAVNERPDLVASSRHPEVTVMRLGKLAGRT